MNSTVTVQYRCTLCCQPDGRDLQIRARGAQEELGDWLTVVRSRVALDHAELSPHCHTPDIMLRFEITPASGGAIGVGVMESIVEEN